MEEFICDSTGEVDNALINKIKRIILQNTHQISRNLLAFFLKGWKEETC